MSGWSAVVASHRGQVRTRNEDRVAAFGWVAPTEQLTPVELRVRDLAPAVVAVADGLGGHTCGDRASQLAVCALMAASPRLVHRDTVLEECLRIHEDLLEDAGRDASRAGMGTTLVAAVCTGDELLVVHVGDSRAYYVEPGLVDQLTEDDSAPDGRLTQCLGGYGTNAVRPWVEAVAVEPPARLLLCTDGLHGIVARDELRALLAEEDPVDCVAGLMNAAFAAGAPDNVSICLIVPGS